MQENYDLFVLFIKPNMKKEEKMRSHWQQHQAGIGYVKSQETKRKLREQKQEQRFNRKILRLCPECGGSGRGLIFKCSYCGGTGRYTG
jgi:hypothetical protein